MMSADKFIQARVHNSNIIVLLEVFVLCFSMSNSSLVARTRRSTDLGLVFENVESSGKCRSGDLCSVE